MHDPDTYRAIATIRRFEERLVELKANGQIQGSMHLCCGQEAISVDACRALESHDALTVTYRGHGWALARGIPPAYLFAELLGRESPLCGGRGGSAYVSSAEHGLLGESSIDLDPQHYRPRGEVESAMEREPLLARLRLSIGAEAAAAIEREVASALAEAPEGALRFPFPDPFTARDRLYA